jgi:hypothetical protein
VTRGGGTSGCWARGGASGVHVDSDGGRSSCGRGGRSTHHMSLRCRESVLHAQLRRLGGHHLHTNCVRIRHRRGGCRVLVEGRRMRISCSSASHLAHSSVEVRLRGGSWLWVTEGHASSSSSHVQLLSHSSP